jgi:hypothetical protein
LPGARLVAGFSRLDRPQPFTTAGSGRPGSALAERGRSITAASFGVIEGWGTAAAAHPPWPGQGQAFAGDPASDGHWFAWRVCGANHRELGRGTSVHPDLESALRSVAGIRTDVGRAVLSYAITSPGGHWTWRMTVDAQPVATSSRAYFRQRECAYAAAAFTAAVSVAMVPTISGR